MLAFVIGASALMGLAVGSFLNVVIARVPEGISVVRPPSRCPRCDVAIGWRDNVPVLSWLLLRGRCRSCAAPITARYPAVEILTVLIFVSAAARVGDVAAGVLPAYCVWGAGLLALSVIDLDHHRLPSRILYPTGFLGGALLVVGAATEGDWRRLTTAAIGALVGFAFMFVIWFVAPGKMGYGDVRLSTLNGLFLGWLTVWHVGVALLVGSALASIVGIALLLLGRVRRATPIPYGPFLAVGAWIAFLAGDPILEWYLP